MSRDTTPVASTAAPAPTYLNALATIGGSVNISSNGALANINALGSLISIGGTLTMTSDPSLVSMIDLIKPTGQLGNLGGALTVVSNPALPSCQPDALKAALVTAQAWNKVNTQSNNLTCVAPKTCSGALLTCQ